MINLITFYEAWDKPEEAKKWQAKLPQTEALDSEKPSFSSAKNTTFHMVTH